MTRDPIHPGKFLADELYQKLLKKYIILLAVH
jgi:plasmid maintenance system antidote protein VapI